MNLALATIVFAHEHPELWTLAALCLLVLGLLVNAGARGARRWLAYGLFAGAAVAALGAGFWAWSWSQRGPGTVKHDRLEVGNLTRAMDTFYATTGRYPAEAEGWSALLDPPGGLPPLLDREPEDRFGRPLRYRLVDGRPCVSADGRDGMPDTEDDVVSRRCRPDADR